MELERSKHVDDAEYLLVQVLVDTARWRGLRPEVTHGRFELLDTMEELVTRLQVEYGQQACLEQSNEKDRQMAESETEN